MYQYVNTNIFFLFSIAFACSECTFVCSMTNLYALAVQLTNNLQKGYVFVLCISINTLLLFFLYCYFKNNFVLLFKKHLIDFIFIIKLR